MRADWWRTDSWKWLLVLLAAVYVATGLKELLVYVLFLVVLLVKPSGLLGKTRA